MTLELFESFLGTFPKFERDIYLERLDRMLKRRADRPVQRRNAKAKATVSILISSSPSSPEVQHAVDVA